VSQDSSYRVFLNGQLVPKSQAVVSVDTVAFKYGAMVFKAYEPTGMSLPGNSSFFVWTIIRTAWSSRFV